MKPKKISVFKYTKPAHQKRRWNPWKREKTIQDAIDALPHNPGGLIWIQEGVHTQTDTINIIDRSNIRIEGAGRETTTIGINVNKPVILVKRTTHDTATSFVLSDLSIKGPGRDQTEGHGLKLENAWSGTLQKVDIYNCRDALHLIEVHWFNFTDIKLAPPPTPALYNYRGIYGTKAVGGEGILAFFDKVWSYGSESDAFHFTHANGMRMLNCEALSPGGRGYFIGANIGVTNLINCAADRCAGNAFHFENPTDLPFIHVEFPWAHLLDTSTAYALYAKNCSKLRLFGGEYWGMQNHSIVIDAGRFIHIISPHCITNQTAAANKEAIKLLNNPEFVKIVSPTMESHNASTSPAIGGPPTGDGIGKVDIVFPSFHQFASLIATNLINASIIRFDADLVGLALEAAIAKKFAFRNIAGEFLTMVDGELILENENRLQAKNVAGTPQSILWMAGDDAVRLKNPAGTLFIGPDMTGTIAIAEGSSGAVLIGRGTTKPSVVDIDSNSNITLRKPVVGEGNINTAGVYQKDGVQVVGARQPAITDATVVGTAEDSVARDKINKILAALRAHGLIAT